MKDGESLWRSYRFFGKYDTVPKSGDKYGCKPTAQEKETPNLSLFVHRNEVKPKIKNQISFSEEEFEGEMLQLNVDYFVFNIAYLT